MSSAEMWGQGENMLRTHYRLSYPEGRTAWIMVRRSFFGDILNTSTKTATFLNYVCLSNFYFLV